MSSLAHSAQNGRPAQSYRDHIIHVYRHAVQYAAEADQHTADHSGQLQLVAARAAEYHDLGKLDVENQNVLQEEAPGQRHLPINHVDAGTAFLLQDHDALLSAIIIYSHHLGLPNLNTEFLRGEKKFRDEHPEIRKKTDRDLSYLIDTHREEIHLTVPVGAERGAGDTGVFLRLALSCLVDADHSDSAGRDPAEEILPELRPKERLDALDRYVQGLEQSNERSHLRSMMYRSCRDAPQYGAFVSCDSPVGSGKTTAIMAHMLAQAEKRGLRRIFVILPYTNIITQAVEVYREALTLPGEDPEEVVAELHHRAEFESEDLRHLTALWRAPVIVTTAVGFFETLASNHPSALRKLHELPGSAIFIDEAHAALPTHLLPTAWHWMKALAEEWGCYWILGSGSLVRFWELSELITERVPDVPELVSDDLRECLMEYEANRVIFRWNSVPASRVDLIQAVLVAPGPRLLIVNTVQNAAVLARDMVKVRGRNAVEHLSTALTSVDREETIQRIRKRLDDPNDTDWTLIATSCVEAGVDFSFRTGFREASSLVSLLQTAGRVNRGGREKNAEVWTFQMQDDVCLNKNRRLDCSSRLLLNYLRKGMTPCPGLSTRSIQDEIHQTDRTGKKLYQQEISGSYKTVAENFAVIDSDTVPVVVDREVAETLCTGKRGWRDLQKHSVTITRYNLKRYGVSELKPGLYCWERPYSPFLGYMEGVIDS